MAQREVLISILRTEGGGQVGRKEGVRDEGRAQKRMEILKKN